MLVGEPNPEIMVPHDVDPRRYEEEEGDGMTTHLPKPLVHFFKGQPEALGATQIFAGVVLLMIGVALISDALYAIENFIIVIGTGLPFWPGILYITSGSVSVAASVKPTVKKVKASLILNILSSLASFIAIIMFSLSLVFDSYGHGERHLCLDYPNEPCKGELIASVFFKGIISILLIFTVLMFCVTTASSVFGCKTTCRTTLTEANIVLYQTSSVTAPDTTSTSPLPCTDPTMIHEAAQSHSINIGSLEEQTQ